MGDIDNPNALSAEALKNGKQILRLGIGQRCRGLVEHQNARVLREGLSDLNQLLSSSSKSTGFDPRIQADAEIVEQPGRLEIELIPLDNSESRRLAPEKDVFSRRELGNLGKLLKHN